MGQIYIAITGTSHYFGASFWSRGWSSLLKIRAIRMTRRRSRRWFLRLERSATLRTARIQCLGCRSAGRIYDSFEQQVYGVIRFIVKDLAIVELMEGIASLDIFLQTEHQSFLEMRKIGVFCFVADLGRDNGKFGECRYIEGRRIGMDLIDRLYQKIKEDPLSPKMLIVPSHSQGHQLLERMCERFGSVFNVKLRHFRAWCMPIRHSSCRVERYVFLRTRKRSGDSTANRIRPKQIRIVILRTNQC